MGNTASSSTPQVFEDAAKIVPNFPDFVVSNLFSSRFLIEHLLQGSTESTYRKRLDVEEFETHKSVLEARVSDANLIQEAGVVETHRNKHHTLARIIEEIASTTNVDSTILRDIDKRNYILSQLYSMTRSEREQARLPYIEPRVTPSDARIGTRDLMLFTLSSLVELVKQKKITRVGAPLGELHDMLQGFEPVELFDDWTPAQLPPEMEVDPVTINAQIFAADSKRRGAAAGLLAASEGESNTKVQAGPELVLLVRFPEPVSLTSITLEWESTHPISKTVAVGVYVGSDPLPYPYTLPDMPADTPVKANMLKASGADDDLFDPLPAAGDAAMELAQRNGMLTVPLMASTVQGIKIAMRGSLSSSSKVPQLRRIRLNERDPTALYTPVASTIQTLQDFMLADVAPAEADSTDSSAADMRVKGLNGSLSLALSTASLTCMLRHVAHLMRQGPQQPLPDAHAAAIEAALARVLEEQKSSALRYAALCGFRGGQTGAINAAFDPSISSSNITFSEGNMLATSSSGSNSTAVVDQTFSEGRVAWEFRLVEDSNGGECTCFGAVRMPLPSDSHSYDSQNHLMIRCYNGQLYGSNRVGSNNRQKIHPGQRIRFEMDFAAGTLSIAVDDTDLGVCFNEITGPIAPAACFYSTGRKLRLESVEILDGGALSLGAAAGVGVSAAAATAPLAAAAAATVAPIPKAPVLTTADDEAAARARTPAITQLMELGFHWFSSARALAASNNDVNAAAEWLFMHMNAEAEQVTQWEGRMADFKKKQAAYEEAIRKQAEDAENAADGSDGSSAARAVATAAADSSFQHSMAPKDSLTAAISMLHCLSEVASTLCPDAVGTTARAAVVEKVKAEHAAKPATTEEAIAAQAAELFLLQAASAPAAVPITIRSRTQAIALEEPFAIQATVSSLALLGDLLALTGELMRSSTSDARTVQLATEGSLCIMSIIRANLSRLLCAHVDPAVVGINTDGSPTLARLHSQLQDLIRADSGHCVRVQMAASCTIDAGLAILYSTARERADLLVDLIESYNRGPVSEAQEDLLARCLKRFSSPDGVVSLLPRPMSQQKAGFVVDSTEVQRIQRLLTLLFGLLSKQSARELQQLKDEEAGHSPAEALARSSSNAAGSTANVLLAHGAKLLRAYQRHLLCLVAEDLHSTAELTPDMLRDLPQHGFVLPAWRTDATGEAQNASSTLLVEYSQLLAEHCHQSLQLLEESVPLESMGLTMRTTISNALRASVLGSLLPSYSISICLLSSSAWLAERILPMFLPVASGLDKVHARLKSSGEVEFAPAAMRPSLSDEERRLRAEEPPKLTEEQKGRKPKKDTKKTNKPDATEVPLCLYRGYIALRDKSHDVYVWLSENCLNNPAIIGHGNMEVGTFKVTGAHSEKQLVLILKAAALDVDDDDSDAGSAVADGDGIDLEAMPFELLELTAELESGKPVRTIQGLCVTKQSADAKKAKADAADGSGKDAEQTASTGAGVVGSFSLWRDSSRQTDQQLNSSWMSWTQELLCTVCSMVGRLAGKVAVGPCVTQEEEHIQPWLQAALFASGMNTESLVDDLRKRGREALPVPAEILPLPVPTPADMPYLTLDSSVFQDTPATPTQGGARSPLPPFIMDCLLQGQAGASSPGSHLLSWLQSKTPENRLQARRGRFPQVELPVLLACLLHCGLVDEVDAAVQRLLAGEAPDAVECSPNVLDAWKQTLKVRYELRQQKIAFRNMAMGSMAADTESGVVLPAGVVGADGSEPSGRVGGSDSKAEEPLAESKDAEDDTAAAGSGTAAGGGTEKPNPRVMTATTATSLEQLEQQLRERALFLLCAGPCHVTRSAGGDAAGEGSQLSGKWQEMLPTHTLKPLTEGWRSTEEENAESGSAKWGGMIAVLHRQRSWQRQHSSNRLTTSGDAGHLLGEDDEETPADLGAQDEKSVTPVQLTCRQVSAFVQNGIVATPTQVIPLLALRSLRAKARTYGMSALANLLRHVSNRTATREALYWIRSALRGITEREEVELRKGKDKSADGDDSKSDTLNSDWNRRHHYLRHVEGCTEAELDRVQAAYIMLFTELSKLLTAAAESADRSLLSSVLWCWSSDFEERDHEFLLRAGLVNIVNDMMSLKARAVSSRERNKLAVLEEESGDLSSMSGGGGGGGGGGDEDIVPRASVASKKSQEVWQISSVIKCLLNGTLSKQSLITYMQQLVRVHTASTKDGAAILAKFGCDGDAASAAAALSVAEVVEAYIELFPLEHSATVTVDDTTGQLVWSAAQEPAAAAGSLLPDFQTPKQERIRKDLKVEGHSEPLVRLPQRASHCNCDICGKSVNERGIAAWADVPNDYDACEACFALRKGHEDWEVAPVTDVTSASKRSNGPMIVPFPPETGRVAYSDKPAYKFHTVPNELKNQWMYYIATRMADKGETAMDALSFTVTRPARIYVLFQQEMAIPKWLADGYTALNMIVQIGVPAPSPFKVWVLNTPIIPGKAGPVRVQLGGAEYSGGPASTANDNYCVLIEELMPQEVAAVQVLMAKQQGALLLPVPVPEAPKRWLVPRGWAMFRLIAALSVGCSSRADGSSGQQNTSSNNATPAQAPATPAGGGGLDSAMANVLPPVPQLGRSASVTNRALGRSKGVGRIALGATLSFSMALQGQIFQLLQDELETAARVVKLGPAALVATTNAHVAHLEAMQVESFAFSVITFLQSIIDRSAAHSHLSTMPFIQSMLTLLGYGSPRCKRMVLRIFRTLLKDMEPVRLDQPIRSAFHEDLVHRWETIANGGALFIGLVFDLIGHPLHQALATADLPGDETQPPATSVSVPDTTPVAFDTSSTGSLFGSGDIAQAVASELVALVRTLLGRTSWRRSLVPHFKEAICDGAAALAGGGVVAQGGLALPTEDAEEDEVTGIVVGGAGAAGDSSVDVFSADPMTYIRCVASLSVLGGHVDCLRTGGRALLAGKHGVMSATVVQLQTGLSTARVIFGHDITETPVSVDVESLCPDAEVPPPVMLLDLTEDLVNSLVAFMGIDSPGIEGTSSSAPASEKPSAGCHMPRVSAPTASTDKQPQLWQSHLRFMALCALNFALQSPKNVATILPRGVLQHLYAVALQPSPLTQFHRPSRLLRTVTALHARLIEGRQGGLLRQDNPSVSNKQREASATAVSESATAAEPDAAEAAVAVTTADDAASDLWDKAQALAKAEELSISLAYHAVSRFGGDIVKATAYAQKVRESLGRVVPPSGRWSGSWTSSSAGSFEFSLILHMEPDHAQLLTALAARPDPSQPLKTIPMRGFIVHTVLQYPLTSQSAFLGRDGHRAVEKLLGTYDVATRTIDAPAVAVSNIGILAPDRYTFTFPDLTFESIKAKAVENDTPSFTSHLSDFHFIHDSVAAMLTSAVDDGGALENLGSVEQLMDAPTLSPQQAAKQRTCTDIESTQYDLYSAVSQSSKAHAMFGLSPVKFSPPTAVRHAGRIAVTFSIDCLGVGSNLLAVGFVTSGATESSTLGQSSSSYGFRSDGRKAHNGVETVFRGSGFKQADRVECVYDRVEHTISFALNGVDLGVAFTDVDGKLVPAVTLGNKDARISIYSCLPGYRFASSVDSIKITDSGLAASSNSSSSSGQTVIASERAPCYSVPAAWRSVAEMRDDCVPLSKILQSMKEAGIGYDDRAKFVRSYEQHEDHATRLAASQQILSGMGAPVFLSSMEPEVTDSGLGEVGFDGASGYRDDEPVTFRDKRLQHSICVHGKAAPSNDARLATPNPTTAKLVGHEVPAAYRASCSCVTYRLDQRFNVFQTRVGLADDVSSISVPTADPESGRGIDKLPSDLLFVVVGDGKILACSELVSEARTATRLVANVFDVYELELLVVCVGSDARGSHAVWLDPHIMGKGMAGLTSGVSVAIGDSKRLADSNIMCQVPVAQLVRAAQPTASRGASNKGSSGQGLLNARVLDRELGVPVPVIAPINRSFLITSMFGAPVDDITAIRSVAARQTDTLAINAARRCIRAAISAWPDEVPLTVQAVGGSAQLTGLLKYATASASSLAAENRDTSTGSEGSSNDEEGNKLSSDNAGMLPVDDPGMETLRATLKRLLQAEASTASAMASSGCKLSRVLLDQTVGNVTGSVGSGAGGSFQHESLHPMDQNATYVRHITVPGANSLIVTFDHRTNFGSVGAKLEFFSDEALQNRLACVNQNHPAPFLVSGHEVFVKVTGRDKLLAVDPMSGEDVSTTTEDSPVWASAWGFAFEVVSAPPQWLQERDVLAGPSLEWACWLLDFLLNDAEQVIQPGMVHNGALFTALVGYLRTRGTPAHLKPQVVNLLSELLRDPDMFDTADMPATDQLDGVADRAIRLAEAYRGRAGGSFLPVRLLQLVELVLLQRRFAKLVASKNVPSAASEPFLASGPSAALCRAVPRSNPAATVDFAALYKAFGAEFDRPGTPVVVFAPSKLEVLARRFAKLTGSPKALGKDAIGIVKIEDAARRMADHTGRDLSSALILVLAMSQDGEYVTWYDFLMMYGLRRTYASFVSWWAERCDAIAGVTLETVCATFDKLPPPIRRDVANPLWSAAPAGPPTVLHPLYPFGSRSRAIVHPVSGPPTMRPAMLGLTCQHSVISSQCKWVEHMVDASAAEAADAATRTANEEQLRETIRQHGTSGFIVVLHTNSTEVLVAILNQKPLAVVLTQSDSLPATVATAFATAYGSGAMDADKTALYAAWADVAAPAAPNVPVFVHAEGMSLSEMKSLFADETLPIPRAVVNYHMLLAPLDTRIAWRSMATSLTESEATENAAAIRAGHSPPLSPSERARLALEDVVSPKAGAERTMLHRAISATTDSNASWAHSPVSLALPTESSDLSDRLMDVVELSHALATGDAPPDPFVCAAWIAAIGGLRHAESPHPCKPGMLVEGTIIIPQADHVVYHIHPRSACPRSAVLSLEDGSGSQIARLVGPEIATAAAGPAKELSHGTVRYKFQVPSYETNAGDFWGFALTVSAIKSSGSSPHTAELPFPTPRARSMLEDHGAHIAGALRRMQDIWTPALDAQLTELARKICDRINAGNKSSSAVSATNLALAELCIPSARDELLFQSLAAIPLEQLRLRYALLRLFNLRLQPCLSQFQLSSTKKWSTGYLLRQLGHCVFYDIKRGLLQKLLRETRGSDGSNPSIRLDNFKAAQSEVRGDSSLETSQCIFVQAFQQMQSMAGSVYRTVREEDRVLHITFQGESGIDAGGVYREGLQRMVEDLFSDRLCLLIPCPNAARKSGENLGSFVPNPAVTTPGAMQMYEFIGKLMGLSLRHDAGLPFMFPSLIWKPLVGDSLSADDLLSVDMMYGQYISAIRDCDKDFTLDGQPHEPIRNDEDFARVFGSQAFVTNDSAGAEVPLVPGGASMCVTFTNRHRFCDLVEHFRLHEFDEQVAAMRRGLSVVVPIRALSLFTWQELDVLVAGRPDINVEVLKRTTRYEGEYSATHPVVKRFWAVFESLSNEERSKYVRFAWGRARLPADPSSWTNKHTLTPRSGGDTTLPVSHTCFFSVELPSYTTEERMRWGLLIALHYGCAGVLNG